MISLQAAAFTCEDYLKRRLSKDEINVLISESYGHLLDNISRAGTAPGTVVASPSQQNPNYYFNWVRDAALVMEVVDDPARLYTYVDRALDEQAVPTASNSLGETRFKIDGSDSPDWISPQNDGPALRAIVATAFAQRLLNEGHRDYVASRLYQAGLPNYSLIKRDLEYTAHHWREPSYDLWEEVYGLSFFTLRAQQRALRAGADLADRMADGGAASFYREQADQIGGKLQEFWDGNRGYVVSEIERRWGGPSKDSGLDLAVVLSANHFTAPGEPFGPTDDRVMATAFHLQQRFAQIYAINKIPEFSGLGTAIGRYPEDTYDGHITGGNGNPWFLATNAFAEFCYRASTAYRHSGKIQITGLNADFLKSLGNMTGADLRPGTALHAGDPMFAQIVNALVSEGDRYIGRVRFHMHLGHMSEQFNRDSGYMQGAFDLTWSYASFISALKARP